MPPQDAYFKLKHIVEEVNSLLRLLNITKFLYSCIYYSTFAALMAQLKTIYWFLPFWAMFALPALFMAFVLH